MIVHNFHVQRILTMPAEANPPLLVHADAVLPGTAAAKGSKAEIKAYLKGAFGYCDGVYSGFTDAHLNDPADFWGAKTNKMFVLTQVANHDALHYGNLVTYLRLNGLEPSGGWF